jgi:hypothetical protein
LGQLKNSDVIQKNIGEIFFPGCSKKFPLSQPNLIPNVEKNEDIYFGAKISGEISPFFDEEIGKILFFKCKFD